MITFAILSALGLEAGTVSYAVFVVECLITTSLLARGIARWSAKPSRTSGSGTHDERPAASASP